MPTRDGSSRDDVAEGTGSPRASHLSLSQGYSMWGPWPLAKRLFSGLPCTRCGHTANISLMTQEQWCGCHLQTWLLKPCTQASLYWPPRGSPNSWTPNLITLRPYQKCRNLDPCHNQNQHLTSSTNRPPAWWSLRSAELEVSGNQLKRGPWTPPQHDFWCRAAQQPELFHERKTHIFLFLSHPITAESLYESRLALPWRTGRK